MTCMWKKTVTQDKSVTWEQRQVLVCSLKCEIHCKSLVLWHSVCTYGASRNSLANQLDQKLLPLDLGQSLHSPEMGMFIMSAVCDCQQATSSAQNRTAEDSAAVGPLVIRVLRLRQSHPLPGRRACCDLCPSRRSRHGCYGNAHGEYSLSDQGVRSERLWPLRLHWRWDNWYHISDNYAPSYYGESYFGIYGGALYIHESVIIATDRKHCVDLYVQLCAKGDGICNIWASYDWVTDIRCADSARQQCVLGMDSTVCFYGHVNVVYRFSVDGSSGRQLIPLCAQRTLKTCFLLSLAVAHRRYFLHAL